MAVEFRLPDVGEGTATAEILEWHVAPGDAVEEDQPMVDVQTDKAIVTIPCPVAGVVLRRMAEAGDTFDVGAVLIVFETTGTGTEGRAPAAVPEPAKGGRAAPPPDAPAPAPGRALASPVVRRLAREIGIDLASVAGSGPGGRVVRSDLERPAASPPAAAGPAPVAPRSIEPTADVIEPLRGTRRVIARALTQSWQTIPHIIDFREVDVTGLVAARDALRAQAEARGDPELARVLTSFALLAKLAAVVARRHPAMRSSIDMERDEVTIYGSVDLSIPIAAPGGLVTPVVAQADRLPLHDVAREIARLSAAARDRKLTPAEMKGGTFTVNNYGALGSPLATTLIQPGQSSNLGFGRAEPKPVVRDGQIVARPMMGISCSGDHRVMDGAEIQAFVNELLGVIENPVLLLGEMA